MIVLQNKLDVPPSLSCTFRVSRHTTEGFTYALKAKTLSRTGAYFVIPSLAASENDQHATDQITYKNNSPFWIVFDEDSMPSHSECVQLMPHLL